MPASAVEVASDIPCTGVVPLPGLPVTRIHFRAPARVYALTRLLYWSAM
jgi:hypothetical protein